MKDARMKDALWVGPLTVFVMLGTFFTQIAKGGHEGLVAWQLVSCLLAGLAGLSLLLARSSPKPAVLLTGLLVGVYFACGFEDGPIYLPVFFAAYAAARSASVRRWVPWVAGSMGLVLLGMAVRTLTTEH